MALPLIDLVPLLMFALALALCLLSLYVAKALFGAAGGAVGWIPGVGGWLKGKIEDVAHKITSDLGHAATVLEGRIGASWHALARQVDWLGHEIASHARLLERIAQDFVTGSYADLLARDLRRIRTLTNGLTHRLEGIGRDVIGRVRAVEHGIGHDVLPRIRSLERSLDRELAHERTRARAAERTLGREVSNLWEWTRTHPWTVVTEAFVAAVAVALSRLGAGWVRCRNWERIGKQVCATDPSVIEDLLAGVLMLAGTFSIVEFVRDAQAIEGAAIDSFAAVIREFPAP